MEVESEIPHPERPAKAKFLDRQRRLGRIAGMTGGKQIARGISSAAPTRMRMILDHSQLARPSKQPIPAHAAFLVKLQLEAAVKAATARGRKSDFAFSHPSPTFS